MGIQSKINQVNKEMQKTKTLAQPGMEVYKKLQAFYKLHPTSTPAVAMEVKRIRDECELFVKALDEKFASEHTQIMSEFMKKELDYVQSYLSPEQKEKDLKVGLQSDVENILKEEVVNDDLPEKKKSFIQNLFSR